MDDHNENITMSRFAFERMQSKEERENNWKNIIILVLIVLLAVTNIVWLYYWNQYDYVDTEEDYSVDVDAGDGGNANYIGNNGDINNGTYQGNEAHKDKEPDA